MKTQYLRHKKKWTAFTTINGVDIYELANSKSEAIAKLMMKINNSEFLLKGIKLP